MSSDMSSGVFDPAQRVGAVPRLLPAVKIAGAQLPAVGTARIYCCGITPYDVTHLGHAATFVWTDVLARTIETTGVSTRIVRNVTDVDDVLTRAARDRGRYYDELALNQESTFTQSMRALRVASPAEQPRARHHVVHVQQLAQALLDVDAAYEHAGTVWFRGSNTPQRAQIDEADALRLALANSDQPYDPSKEHPLDVAVWRPSDADHPAWLSPWGWGRPGWHAECAAMAMATQGANIDVLVGGQDLAYPHHCYQAAMIEAVSGVTPFARATLHIGTVLLRGEEMAKSTGNLILIDDLLETWPPALLRLALIDRPVNEPWDFADLDLPLLKERLHGLYSAAAKPTQSDFAPIQARLTSELDVSGALDLALETGGEAAKSTIACLRLTP